ncbi:hypothetical protein [Nostoc sp. FACHB-888]|uniref:hypothetical protein n=1 Tax=Nostoc sp. FACHB-888 TaxID=2692842 RepID=UPI001993AA20|nr:hypothetical protein [Nostoc sp. FACHB-888]MBD2245903.1 hypothetical protein [Nostoc sp. FACHB-888]
MGKQRTAAASASSAQTFDFFKQMGIFYFEQPSFVQVALMYLDILVEIGHILSAKH